MSLSDHNSSFISQTNLEEPQIPPAVVLPRSMASQDSEQDGGPVVLKGKQRSIPMPIRASSIVHDLFDISSPSSGYKPSESSPSSSTAFSPSSSNLSSDNFDSMYLHHNLSIDSMEQLEFRNEEGPNPSEESFHHGKGKEKAALSYLPPLTFSVIQLDPNFELSPTSGSSSYGTLYSPVQTSECFIPSSTDSDREIAASPRSSLVSGSQDSYKPQLPRCRSLSNLSQSISPLLANVLLANNIDHNPQLTSSTLGSSRAPSNLMLQLGQQDPSVATIVHLNGQVPEPLPTILSLVKEPNSYPPAWYTANKPATPQIHSPSPRPGYKAKARSKSSPYPISVLDFFPHTSTDIFQPLSIVIPNYFDLILPKELRLHILRALVESHEQDYQRSIREGRLTLAKATSSKNRWVGKDKAIRELFRLSRVSKGWRSLVFDGELWADIDLRSFHCLPPAIVSKLVQATGSFVRKINFAGHTQLHADDLAEITNSLCLTVPQVPHSFTQITTANFQGCISLTTRSLHNFLARSRSLEHLCLKGLTVVTNTTCDVLSNSCPKLITLNLSRCPNLDGHGVGGLTASAIFRKEHLPLRELRLSGLKYVSDSMMQALGRAAPYLEVLDLSHSRQLRNSAVEAFVACESHIDHQLALETTFVSSRDLGRDTSSDNAPIRLKRRVTRLRHLNLSFCILLTDTACSNLAHSVPNLEFLELAGIGADLKDAGLIRLLNTTTRIRCLDLEDAIAITDAVLSVITPVVEASPTSNSSRPSATPSPMNQPGHALQHLIVSHAGHISNAAFSALIRNCPQLTVLEADNTRIDATVFKEFVSRSREKRLLNAKIVAVDCRGVDESTVKGLSPMTRPRLGWRAYGARRLSYLDARDDNEEDLKVGQDECDEQRIIVKTFYSWQTVDAVKAAREKRRKANGSHSRRTASDSSTASHDIGFDGIMIGAGAGRAGGSANPRWWSPGGRTRSPSRASQPVLADFNNEGCRTM